RRVVGSDRFTRTAAFDHETAGSNTLADQIIARAGGALYRQRIIDRIGTRTVGMADDGNGGRRIVDQAGGELVEYRPEIGFDGRAAGIKGNVAGNLELELIVSGLTDGDAGAGGSRFHLLFLFLHFLRP